MQKYLCGVPKDRCCGASWNVNKGLHFNRVHDSPVEAFNCHKRYLLSLGYIQIGSREFKDPQDGFIKVLTKKTNFGTPVRRGKVGENVAGKRCTFMKVAGAIIEAP